MSQFDKRPILKDVDKIDSIIEESNIMLNTPKNQE